MQTKRNKTGLRPVSRPVEHETVPPLPELVETHRGDRNDGRVNGRAWNLPMCCLGVIKSNFKET